VARKRRKRRRHGSTLRLFAILVGLVGINVYVFFYSPGNLKQVSQAAQAASVGALAEPAPVPAAPVAKAAGKKKDGTVKEREGLGAVLRREALLPADADAVLRALQPVMDFKKEIHGGQRYTLRTAADGKLESFELRAASGATYAAVREDGKLVGKKTEPPSPSVSRRSGSARTASGTP
jgi:hypothetical protein